MVKLVDKQNIFNHGILSPKLYSRDDLKQYNGGIQDAVNFICSRYGPMEKRVGTEFVRDLGNPGQAAFFMPFAFSISQTLLLEFIPGYIRFYAFDAATSMNFGAIKDPGFTWVSSEGNVLYTSTATPTTTDMAYPNRYLAEADKKAITAVAEGSITVEGVVYTRMDIAYEIETPFSEEDVRKIDYVQSLDVVYLAFAKPSDGSPQKPPYKLTRRANDNWELSLFEAEDGPYLDANYDSSRKMKITDKNTDISIVTLTNVSFGTADIGRWIRINTPRYNENTYQFEDRWSYGRIHEITSASQIKVKWQHRATTSETTENWQTDETSEWRLGAWHNGTSNADEFPVTYPTKVTIHQQRLVWAGLTDRPWIWTSNSNAYNNYAPSDYEGTANDANSITVDISTDKVSEIYWMKSLKSLLVGTELGEIRVYSSGAALTPNDHVANRESSYGSYDGDPIVTDDMLIFIQRLQRTLRSLSYDYNADAYIGPELTILAESLTSSGIKKLAYQKEPNNTIWCVREDGSLLTLTYDKSQDVVGWSKSKLAGKDVKVIDAIVLPSKAYQQDMVLFVVERVIDGHTVRYLELLSKNFTVDLAAEDAIFLDCTLSPVFDTPTDTIDGLDYLEGETVRVMEDGALVGEGVVENGKITVEIEVTHPKVGLPYEAYFETLERDFGDKQISTKMSKLRVYKARLYVVRTLGLTLQRLDKGLVTTLVTFSPKQITDTTPDLVSGKVDIETSSAWDCDYRLRITSEPGLPCTVSGIILGVEINAI